jgi:hypothetical protein
MSKYSAAIAGLIVEATNAHADATVEASAAPAVPSEGLPQENGNIHAERRVRDVSDRG